MKKLGLVLGLIVVSSAAMASDRFDRILSDSVLQSNIAAMQSKYGVQCNLPSESDATGVAWRCLNGPQCGYTITISCPMSADGHEMGGWELKVSGFDTGSVNDVQQIEFVRLR